MEYLWAFFDTNTIAFIWLDYSFSWLEVVGVVFNLISVWLLARNRVLGWPIGLIGVVLFLFLFYQVRLYSDAVEQIYYLVTGLYGWWLWREVKDRPALPIEQLSYRERGIWFGVFVLGSYALGHFMSQIHIYLPGIFKEPADFPYLDAGTTVAGFIANYLMATRKFDNWPIWVMVNIVCIYIYFSKSMLAMSVLYAIFLVFAFKGMILWWKMLKGHPVKTFV
jgi:nicotinamide mononucleotide transporter